MTVNESEDYQSFSCAVQGLLRGDFSRLEPLFDRQQSPEQNQCHILEWYKKGYFENEPEALQEALTCACFLGRTDVAEFLLRQGVNPTAGNKTGVNAFHWAANRGQLETVKFLIRENLPLETRNMYDGTVLGMTVWSAIHEPRPDHFAIIEALIEAGARLDASGYPTGNERIDELLRRHGAKS
jgi:hypothetical protein